MTRAEGARGHRDILMALAPADRREMLARLTDDERHALRCYWEVWAHGGQLPPPGRWHTWLIMAGRGFGKTRAGAEWVRDVARRPTARIALVAASLGEARRVMVEGESGLLAISPRGKRPGFEPSKRTLTGDSGAQATLYSAAEPDSLRGPQHSHACRPGAEGTDRQRGHASRGSGHPERGGGETAMPPASPLPGQAWLVGAEPTGAFAGHAAAIAGWTAAGWRFVEAATGMRVFDKSASCFRHFDGGWNTPIAPPAPSGDNRQRGSNSARRHSGKTGRCRHLCDELSGTIVSLWDFASTGGTFRADWLVHRAKAWLCCNSRRFCPLAPV